MSSHKLFKIAGLIAVITIISKVAGFFRDVVIAQYYGASVISDAYFYAYQIPAFALILLGGLGGPFHTATIAFFGKAVKDKSAPSTDVNRVMSTFLTATGIFFLILSVLVFFFSDQIVAVIAAHGSIQLKTLASFQLKLMSPIMFIGGLIGIFYGIANVFDEFFFTSLSPVVASACVIAALFLFDKDQYGAILATATLVGAVGQLLIQLPVFLRSGFVYKPSFDFFSPSMKKIKEILFPAMIGTTIGQINIYIDMFFASQLEEGAWSAIAYANRIFQFPVGILITSMLVPLFPMFSNFVADKDWDALKKYFRQGVLSLWYFAFPILMLIFLLAQDAIRLLFQRGQFDSHDTFMVTEALFYLSVSIIPYAARDTLTRVFYAFDDSKTPFYVAMASILLKALLNYLLIGPLGLAAITLSTTIITFTNGLLLAILLIKKIKMDYYSLIPNTLKLTLATAGSALVIIPVNIWIAAFLGEETFLILAFRLGLVTVIGFIVYFFLTMLLKIDIAHYVLNKLKDKIIK